MGGFPLSLLEDLALKSFLAGSKEKPRSCHCHSVNVSGWKGKALQGGTEEQISCLET